LYADFSNYTIYYECRELEDNKSVDFLWIFSRAPRMRPNILKQALEKASEYFPIEKLHTVKHDEEYCGDYLN
jgi:lipocalin